ncbi:arylesterase monooxygenase [Colletotrichum karsti]|uniref:Arylesterase monooxygenase n=1 Tax=Colletotrichum karsti TaxID=1095194 RepID=A0A9P6LDT2_9PEZI|nr:arylesterase monooxygenase [Colletotrichum karsti]KAF9869236.1 arylesterase monooxygenase [Colletotrichum karsti]
MATATNELRYDPEYLAVISAREGPTRTVPFKDAHELRAWQEPMMRSVLRAQPSPEHVLETKIPFQSHDGQEINIVRFATKDMIEAAEPQPAIVYVHGGGFIMCDVDIFAPQIKRFVDTIGMPFFAVDYRLAPEFPDGLGAEDVYFGLKHLSENAKQWNVDASNIVIMGDSAGGGIAAGATLIARDRGLSPRLRKQVLVYPMLDDRTKIDASHGIYSFLTWNTNDNRIAWGAVLGDKAGDPDAEVSLYAAPGRASAEDLRGLPPAYIDVGGLDLFRDECLEYALKLSRADVEVEFHMWPGLPHGFESAPDIEWARKALEARNAAVKRL